MAKMSAFARNRQQYLLTSRPTVRYPDYPGGTLVVKGRRFISRNLDFTRRALLGPREYEKRPRGVAVVGFFY